MPMPFSLRSPSVTTTLESGLTGMHDLAPIEATGAKVGYARVSNAGQLLDRQITALTTASWLYPPR
jgi:hypothetical protein